MLALSIRQPFAEMILRGIKTIEYRSRATRIIGERFYIYAAKGGLKKKPEADAAAALRPNVWSKDLVVPGEPPVWMYQIAEALKLFGPDVELPRGVIVGTGVISKCVKGAVPISVDGKPAEMTELYEWHLTDVQRLKQPRKPTGRPQPVWFQPF